MLRSLVDPERESFLPTNVLRQTTAATKEYLLAWQEQEAQGEAIWSVFGFGLARERVCDESESSESESDSFRHYLRVVYEASLSCFPAEPLKVTDCSLSRG